MAEQICPACGCVVSPGDAYEKEGVVYCCKPCAETSQCECGCCEVHEEAH
ncbi:MAG: metallothionein [Chloroflexi bacterium]|nr:metallothionein [Chloroflexota bacterium]